MGGAESRTPGFVWTTPEEVAEQAVSGAERGKRVVVPGDAQPGDRDRRPALAAHAAAAAGAADLAPRRRRLGAQLADLGLEQASAAQRHGGELERQRDERDRQRRDDRDGGVDREREPGCARLPAAAGRSALGPQSRRGR